MFLFRIIQVTSSVFAFLKEQKRFNGRYIPSYLQRFYDSGYPQLKHNQLAKIENYYCLALPLFASAYTQLYGRKLSQKEREQATLLGIFVPLIDDFTDEKTLSPNAIDQLVFDSTAPDLLSTEQAIVKSIGSRLTQEVQEPQAFLDFLKKSIQAQHDSIRQLEPSISQQDLLRITQEKGGWSFVLLHTILDARIDTETSQALYQLGGVVQLCNDIFDVYKDYIDGITTLAQPCENYGELERFYIQACRAYFAATRSLNLEKKAITKHNMYFALVLARGLVALRMLGNLQIQMGGGALRIADLQRKQLICDMEKPIHTFKTLVYAYQLLAK